MSKKQGFTLAELCISIITISIITATIAPVITKKLSTRPTANANQLTSDCAQFDTKLGSEEFIGYCRLCYEHKCVSCKLDYRPGYVIIQDTCSYKSCKELHGNSCTEICTEIECLDSNTKSSTDPSTWQYHYQAYGS